MRRARDVAWASTVRNKIDQLEWTIRLPVLRHHRGNDLPVGGADGSDVARTQVMLCRICCRRHGVLAGSRSQHFIIWPGILARSPVKNVEEYLRVLEIVLLISRALGRRAA